jgi:hypothetical protein
MQAREIKLFPIVASLTLFLVALFSAETGSAGKDAQLSADQARVLEQARASALAYSHSLPDFICRQITHRETSSVSANAVLGAGWDGSGNARLPVTAAANSGDVIEEQLTFVGQKENYQVLTINERKAGLKHEQLFGMISAGEFGSALTEMFDPQSQTEFTWDRMAKVRGRRVYVFGFHVPAEHGATVILRNPGRQIVVAYGGQVFVDAAELNVLEIRSSLDLPPNPSMQRGESSVEYGPVEIAGKSYNLPLHSEVLVQDKEYLYVNRIDFKNYQRFVVESTIHYDK